MMHPSKRLRLENGGTGGFTDLRESLAKELLAAVRSDRGRVRDLVDASADTWYQDDAGWTCLHHAAESGDVELVRFLLQNGAVWNMTDTLGLTAGDVAFSVNDADVYDVILQEGIRRVMLDAVLNDTSIREDRHEGDPAADLDAFLKCRLRFEADEGGDMRCLDADGNGVMMAWEGDIMRRTVQLLCSTEPALPRGDFTVLNVGFGLGLFDTAMQEYRPSKHVIVEAHPDVRTYMRTHGWYERETVEIFEGTWQEYLERQSGDVFDAIYCRAKGHVQYGDLRGFFEELPTLLRDDSARFSFFNGLGATSRLFLDVYTTVAEMHLRDIGLSTTWHDVDVVNGGEVVWQGVKRRYWNVPATYRLPICKMMRL